MPKKQTVTVKVDCDECNDKANLIREIEEQMEQRGWKKNITFARAVNEALRIAGFTRGTPIFNEEIPTAVTFHREKK